MMPWRQYQRVQRIGDHVVAILSVLAAMLTWSVALLVAAQ